MAHSAFRLTVLGTLIALAAPAWPHEPTAAAQPNSSLAAAARGPAATVDAFHAALRRGDTRGASDLLAANALIFEGGGVERSKAEYEAHHLAADAAFSQAVPSVVTRRAGDSDGQVAWIASEGRTTGTYKGKAVDRVTGETMVLRRVGGAWRIVHIHWSSAAAPAAVAAMGERLLANSSPANGAVIRGPVSSLELHFSRPARLLEVVVSGPEGQMPMMVTAVGETPHYALPVPALGPGKYSVGYRASAAGREDRGTFSFTVR